MDNFSTQIILILLTASGGGFFGAYFQNRFQHKKGIQADIHEMKRKRYGAILLQVLTVLDPKRGLSKIKELRPDFENLEDVKEELIDEEVEYTSSKYEIALGMVRIISTEFDVVCYY